MPSYGRSCYPSQIQQRRPVFQLVGVATNLQMAFHSVTPTVATSSDLLKTAVLSPLGTNINFFQSTAKPPMDSPDFVHFSGLSLSDSEAEIIVSNNSEEPASDSRQGEGRESHLTALKESRGITEVSQLKKKTVRKPKSKILMEELRPVYKPKYYFEDGLRRVVPYNYTYNTFCKERWRGKGLLEIFLSEFRDRPAEYYEKAIAEGKVTINGHEKSTLDTALRNGDIISHTLHRHEPPVTAKPIGIVHEDDKLIVINKPAGMPVHPAGRYNFNSIIEIMRHERNNSLNPLPCNRLDRLTSGLMFIAKTPRAAEELMTQLKTRTVKKTYIARVKGNFPDGDEVLCEEPILAISPKLGLNRVRANGKTARTIFRKISYHPRRDYSIVECLPLTGRTHQIRVHLQWLGHPITNDPIYCNQKVWGINLGKFGDGDDEDIISRLSRMGKDEVADAVDYYNDMMKEYNTRKAEKLTGQVCSVCDAPLYSDPGPHELGIYLHAKRYECEEGRWAFETALPEWATEEVSGPPTPVLEPVSELREVNVNMNEENEERMMT